ncbi:6,7-dimethyl-8-ribityllumazine synthase [Magnetospirillum aberrantis]|uniref:6,7-dimethyl-8-ribityllumazine synthase n=1 Tax=Magnetospirillum aberrantis SpK TaxID=908842 RepID=A0A7C9QSY8_9PROT|nr:6,7-dimethyl-8-ribityllumazine synthase [Magnetospirillum aberrantis]NFV79918.1 6,7-dimethyl-8-ribityllumazine synthase [Magnetospirillum aberrantis SpK]
MSEPRVLIIEARFYDHLADMLLAGAVQTLETAGVAWDKVTLPGILELPAALEMFAAAQELGTADIRYDGFVLLGTAIRGESDHYHHVSTACVNGCSEVATRRHLAVGSGVLTVHNETQALNRADPARKNLGGQAARACLRMLDLKRTLKLTR